MCSLCQLACRDDVSHNVQSEKGSLSKPGVDDGLQDSVAINKAALTNIYTQAIDEFITVVDRSKHITFDTLYFGKHVYHQEDDFPDITLPSMIHKTQIKLISPEAGKRIQNERKSSVYINLMGWVDQAKAEFVFVVFSNGFVHQYDYYINFNAGSHKYELQSIAYENYATLQGQKPKRISVYNMGKYLDGK